MTNDEAEKQDYRNVSKRCFIYTKNNFEEDILPELVDYYKGERTVILEEFIKSLSRLPSIYAIPIKVLEICASFIRIFF